MRIRHRKPTIFSLSMLDVLCCGLGAVIMLMLLNYWDARRQADSLAAARESEEVTLRKLETSEENVARTSVEIQRLESELARTLARLREERRTREREIMDFETRLALYEKEKVQLRESLANQQQQSNELGRELDRITESRNILRTELIAALDAVELSNQQWAETSRQLEETRSQKAIAERTVAGIPNLESRLAKSQQLATDLQNRLEQAESMVAALKKEQAEAEQLEKSAAGRLATAQERIDTAQREMDALRRRVEQLGVKLQEEGQQHDQVLKKQLADARRDLSEQKTANVQLRRRTSQLEDRFAGVDLAGHRIIFLIDTSGSMGAIDSETPDSQKWPEVIERTANLLRSLKDAQRYQVLAFSDEVSHVLGSPGEFLTFDPETSPNQVAQALRQVQPRGNTNMYAAFEAAFQYATDGLDAIYVISDGLPNTGPGLASPPPRGETVRSQQLGRHLRETIRSRWNNRSPRVRIHAVGFFYESPTLGAFLWGLTRENGGSFVGMSKP